MERESSPSAPWPRACSPTGTCTASPPTAVQNRRPFLKEASLTDERLSQIRALNQLAEGRGQTLAEMALSWVLHDQAVTSVLIGASKPAQILDNIKALENTAFSEEELKQIDAIAFG